MKFFTTLFLTFICAVQFSTAQCWQKIASKQDHVIAINLDGTLWNWGGALGAHRLLTTPTILDTNTNWIDIAAGNQFYAALKSDGTLWTWGDNSGGQLGTGSTTNVWAPSMLGADTNWVKVSCGDGHMVAIKNDGTLWIWGRNNNGQLGKGTNRTNALIPEQLGTDSNWVDVSAGKNHTLIKKSDNSLWFVGACYNTSLVSQLWKIGSTNDWACMSGGSFTDYAIKLNGELWTWNNSNGKNTAPTKVGNQSDWLKVDNSHTYSPEYHALFLKTDGSLWAIGNNLFGQLGNGTTVNQSGTPTQIGTDNNWKDITAGSHYSFGLKYDNSFFAWGRNQHAQFGNGENKNTIMPIDNNFFWKKISSSVGTYNGHTLAIQNNGTLWAWGNNNDGQLGNGSTYTHQALPLKVGNDSSWSKITNGFHFSIALKEDSTLWAWGRNSRRQLGLSGSTSNRTSPVIVNNDSNWVDISAGSEFVIALKNNGTLWAWGYNYDGQLGDGTSNTLEIPTQIGTDTNWIAIAAGYNHSMGLKADSTLWTWGNNQYGQLGRTGNTKIPMQVGTDKWCTIATGGFHSFGIKSDSSLWAWGRNLYAQLGDNSTNNKTTPTKIGNDNTWVAVTAGYEHSLGLQADSSLWAWGRNAAGQLGDTATYHDFLAKTFVPTKVHPQNNWKKIEAGTVNSIALNTDGVLFTFGDSYVVDSQMNFPQLGYIYNTPILIYSCASCTTSSHINWEICSGDSFFFNGNFLSNAGVYYDTLQNAAGCDSIIEFNLIVNPIYEFIENAATCAGITYFWRGYDYSIAGMYYDSLLTQNGCDSVYALNLTVNSVYEFSQNESICLGDVFLWRGNNFSTTGTYLDSLTTQHGCDSVYVLNLTVNDLPSISLSGLNNFYCEYHDVSVMSGSPIGGTFTGQGVNGNEFNPSLAGIGNWPIFYSYTDGNGCSNSDTVWVEVDACVGIATQGKQEITLYPNPNDGNFTIELPEKAYITVYNTLGMIVYEGSFMKGSHSFRLGHLADGVYLIKTESQSTVQAIKVIIKK